MSSLPIINADVYLVIVEASDHAIEYIKTRPQRDRQEPIEGRGQCGLPIMLQVCMVHQTTKRVSAVIPIEGPTIKP